MDNKELVADIKETPVDVIKAPVVKPYIFRLSQTARPPPRIRRPHSKK